MKCTPALTEYLKGGLNVVMATLYLPDFDVVFSFTVEIKNQTLKTTHRLPFSFGLSPLPAGPLCAQLYNLAQQVLFANGYDLRVGFGS